MKPKELLVLLKDNEGKFEIIEKIMQLHPGLGTDKGWSYYVGGMADTGEWYLYKLLQASKNELEVFYEINTREPEISKVPAKSEKELLTEWYAEMQSRIIWGK